MTKDSKSVAAAVEGDTEDRISDLPKNIIDDILSLLPVCDAARTSILSKNWRYIWPRLPNLVLDRQFCNKLALKSQSAFKETVDMILLQHIGDIVKFDLDVSGVQLSSHTDIDRWMLYVTRNGVKDLTLSMSSNTSCAYKKPSYIFNCLTLTHLTLFNCIFKPPKSFLGFDNLITLSLERITFLPTTEFCVINVPLLMYLDLSYCDGTQYLKIVSAGLKSLYLCGSCCNLDLSCFMNCKRLTDLYLEVDNFSTATERFTLERLLLSLPTLDVLTLYSLELLSAGAIPKGLPFTLNCLWHLALGVNFTQLNQICYAFEMIKSSPILTQLEIWVYDSLCAAEAVLKYMNTPTCLDQPLNKLKDVTIHTFEGSDTELVLIKLLLAHTPSLVRMRINPGGSLEDWYIARELLRYPRASPNGAILYSI